MRIRDVERMLEKKVDELANEIFHELVAAVPVRTGATKQSFRNIKSGKFTHMVGSYALTAKYADEGNGPGRIYPKHARVLRFRGMDGKMYYAQSVSSYKGDHFVRDVANRHR